MTVKRRVVLVLLAYFVFFMISFLTNILNPLSPDIKSTFDLSDALVGLIPFAFFIAYGPMSIPAGMLLEKYGEKSVFICSFFLAFLGSLLFGTFPTYPVYIISLFIIGSGIAMLQVVNNPLLRSAGGEKLFAFFSVVGQLVFSSAAVFGPQIYKYIVTNINTTSSNAFLDLLSSLVKSNPSWTALYWIFAVGTLFAIGVIAITKFPKVELQEDERAGTKDTYVELLKNKFVYLFFIGIFAYVGTEQGVGYWISSFMQRYHEWDPETQGANLVSRFWGFLTIGCVFSLLLLALFDCRKILVGFVSGALVCLTLGLIGSEKTAFWAFPMVGFFLSVMWSAVFSLGMNSVPKHHGSLSGILCTGIIGGAFVPFIIGGLSGLFGDLKMGMIFLYVTLGYLLLIGFWAKPIVENATFLDRWREKRKLKEA